jgi:PAS domain S-box-containing protein
LVVVDGEGLVSHWSTGARRLFGLAKEEALGRPAIDLLPVEAIPDYFRSAGLDVLERGALPLTTTEYAADGSRIQVPTNWLVAGRRG